MLNSLIPYANHMVLVYLPQMLVNIPYMEHVGMVLFMVCRPLSRYIEISGGWNSFATYILVFPTLIPFILS